MSAYYNEFDPKAAAWLRQLIKNGDIAPGEVDERSIIDVTPADLAGFTQHHFFAGIGVWSYALRNSGWVDHRPICTASLPCQPFSAAGKQKGTSDERHLLPHFLDLVRECGFDTIIGEQVESAIRHGWLDDLHTEMEAQGYAVGHCVLGAHSAGSFHQRQRLYWVAKSVANPSSTQFGSGTKVDSVLSGMRENRQISHNTDRPSETHIVSMAHASRERLQRHRGFEQVAVSQMREGEKRYFAESGMGNAEHDGQLASPFTGSNAETVCNSKTRANSPSESKGAGSSGIVSEDIEWLYCRDNKYRAVKSGLKPLVDGSAEGVGYSGDPSQPIDADYSAEARVMRLKGYGNAIQAGTAQMFIEAFMEAV